MTVSRTNPASSATREASAPRPTPPPAPSAAESGAGVHPPTTPSALDQTAALDERSPRPMTPAAVGEAVASSTSSPRHPPRNASCRRSDPPPQESKIERPAAGSASETSACRLTRNHACCRRAYRRPDLGTDRTRSLRTRRRSPSGYRPRRSRRSTREKVPASSNRPPGSPTGYGTAVDAPWGGCS